jgi:hypothetical protein
MDQSGRRVPSLGSGMSVCGLNTLTVALSLTAMSAGANGFHEMNGRPPPSALCSNAEVSVAHWDSERAAVAARSPVDHRRLRRVE